MSKTNQSKKYADPTTENKKQRAGKQKTTEQTRIKQRARDILEQFVKSKGTVTTFQLKTKRFMQN